MFGGPPGGPGAKACFEGLLHSLLVWNVFFDALVFIKRSLKTEDTSLRPKIRYKCPPRLSQGPTLFPRRDKKGLLWTPLMTVPDKFHYFSYLKNVFKTWFWRPINDLIELCFLWFYMCFCKINHLNRYFETLYGLFSSWWPNRAIIWYYLYIIILVCLSVCLSVCPSHFASAHICHPLLVTFPLPPPLCHVFY